MGAAQPKNEVAVWRMPLYGWILLCVMLLIAVVMFREGLGHMVNEWSSSAEYSYGYLIPLISLFLVWQKKDRLERLVFLGSWSGVVVTLVGLLLFMVGDLSTLYPIIQYSFIVTVAGVALSLMGWKPFRMIWVPLLILMFMVPLPTFLFNNLSAQLQLISSQLGVAIIRLFNISVYLEGNVVDLGTYKLQVVEACSGLRYLFPLMTLGFIAAYFFNGRLWMRTVIFLSSIPVTILMNSFRIGMIGVMVDRWGQSMAVGFLHDFEGWAVFMACTAILLLEMWLLSMIGRDPKPMREIFGLDMPVPTPAGAVIQCRKIPKQVTIAATVIAVGALAATQVGTREVIIPARVDFANFPMEFDGWKGRRDQLEQIYVDALKFDDYILANFTNDHRRLINFYVAYYGAQSKGESAHSPRSCIPGGGWEIKSLGQVTLDEAQIYGRPLRVNRALIEKGDNAQLVYYWFQQRGRIITNEYLVKWYLFWDALTRQRTDGALVRLVVSLGPGEDPSVGDQQLRAFAGAVIGKLKPYIPG